MTKPLLSLLIPRTPETEVTFQSLRNEIKRQMDSLSLTPQAVQLLACNTPKYVKEAPIREHSIGFKRNLLLDQASGEYVAFIDSDDRISPIYLERVMFGIAHGVDNCSLKGVITWDGQNPKPFIHSVAYDKYWEDEIAFYRYPNHLNCIKAEIAKQFRFPEQKHNFGDAMHGEDTDWATQIFQSGLLKNEYRINEVIYYYDYISNK